MECHPYFQRSIDLEYAQKHNVRLEAWAPFSAGKVDLHSDPILCRIAKEYETYIAAISALERNETAFYLHNTPEVVETTHSSLNKTREEFKESISK